MAVLIANLPAEVEDLQPGDEFLTADELSAIALFETLTKAPSFGKYPGATVLRKCPPGRVMCSQGEGGATAFYILTTEDVLRVRQKQLESLAAAGDAPADRKSARRADALKQEIDELQQRLDSDRQDGRETEPAERRVASANLLVDLEGNRRRPGFLRRLFGGGRPTRNNGGRPRPDYIPNDGPADIDAGTMAAPLHESELFGEMSCMNRAPRSATVVTERDCYMLEMLRNLLDMLHKDPAYKEQMDDVYRHRVLETQVRRLPFFQELADDEFRELRDQAQLYEFESGAVIFDEHDPSDGFYVIRSGVVKVVKNAGCMIGPDEIIAAKWPALLSELAAGEKAADEPIGKVWRTFNAEVLETVRRICNAEDVSIEDRETIRGGLNALIRNGVLHTALGKQKSDVLAAAGMAGDEQTFADFDEKTADWSPLERRVFHRLLLEKICPAGMPRRAAVTLHRRTLAYLGRGDCIGEMGVVAGEPRNATCIAYDHPDSGQKIATEATGAVPSRVEAVRIPADVFRKLLQSSPALRTRVDTLVQERTKRTGVEMTRRVGDSAGRGAHTPQFEDLGLIQGQRLMLIDLDRCTRCDRCVDACIKAHDDGRTRLYLDGPRFEKYLVPLTCRSCLDPVCMIGCPVGSIQRGDNGEIQIRDWCIGCGLCADQCPYGSIQMGELLKPFQPTASQQSALEQGAELKAVTEQAVVCDLCSSLPSQDPACVYACPHDAALRVNAQEFFIQHSASSADR